MAAETSTKKFLAQKVGPLPVWAWLAIFAALWYYMQRHNAPAAAAAGSGTGYGTDPAGNAGYIDPSTGYVYGSAEDIASLQNQGQVASNTYAGTGTGTASSGGYQTDAAWGEAAVNYLVARGIDPTTANQAIQLYLAGQNLSPEQQADANLAITGIGAPPQLPSPSTSSPGPVATPGGGTTPPPTPPPTVTPPIVGPPRPVQGPVSPPVTRTARPPATPGGVSASDIGSHGFTLHWNKVSGATSYRIRITYQSRLIRQQTSPVNSAVVSGLTPDHTYGVHVASVGPGGTSSETGSNVKTTR